MNAGTMRFNFDEPVQSSSLTLGGVITATDGGDASYNLTGGYSISDNGLQLLAVLAKVDTDALKQDTNLFTEQNTTFIFYTDSLVKDMAGEPVSPRTDDSALRTIQFDDDETRPKLLSFDLNMNVEPGTFSLHFNETVDVSEFKLEFITLQNRFDANRTATEIDNGWYTLTGGTVNTVLNTTTILVTLDADDFDALKVRGIGSDEESSWLTMEAGAATDMFGVLSASIVNGVSALKVDALERDKKRPTLEHFDLDMNLGKMYLYFDEPVEESALDITGIKLQNKVCDPGLGTCMP